MGFGHGEKPKGREVGVLLPLTPRSRASSMRSVHTEGSTQDHRPRMSPPCVAVSSTPAGLSSLVVFVTHPPPCPAFAPRPLWRLIATMRALTPAAVTCDRQVSWVPLHGLHDVLSPPTRRRLLTPASPFPSRLATTPGRIGFVSYGPPLRLRLLPTSPHGDAVTFDYGPGCWPDGDSHPTIRAASPAHWEHLPGSTIQPVAAGCCSHDPGFAQVCRRDACPTKRGVGLATYTRSPRHFGPRDDTGSHRALHGAALALRGLAVTTIPLRPTASRH